VYSPALDHIVPVNTPEVAEMTKLLENIFRSVNIALVNELAMLCDRMSIDVWEVIDAAATKPFGFMKFQPGPGLGGHCIPIDPFYLSWKAREFDFWTEFIELAGKVNENMPYFCVEKLNRALNTRQKSLSGARVLVLGVAYKADIDDLRESPALKVIRLLRARGAEVDYHDPYCPSLPDFGLQSVDLDGYDSLADYDAVTIVTAHSTLDYRSIVAGADLVIDFRNATAGIPSVGNVWKL
jgi:UDP-N-acetyl-D-glucosamine dehydrogenase